MDVKYTDKLTLFLGKPVRVTDTVFLYSPTVEEIDELGEMMYHTYVSVLSFDLKTIFVDLLQRKKSEIVELEEKDRYFIIVLNEQINGLICEALSFFTKTHVNFDFESLTFYCNNEPLIDSNTFEIISKMIEEVNAEEKKIEPKIKFLNKEAEKMYYVMLERKKQFEKNKKSADGQGLTLKDILSILCVSEIHGVNIFNAGKLTIYQVKEQFNRLQIKESHNRIFSIYSAGNLNTEKTKVPEWFVNTKL